MKELFDLFTELKLPYFRQGTLSDDEYPGSFFTFDNFDTINDCFYDNDEKCYIEKINVYFYTNNIKILYSTMEDFIAKAKSKNFIVQGKDKDAYSGRTDYYGRYITINIIHRI
ncbi:MAG: hypothetical protein SPJ27_04615 [Candidatus Onthovivens sp.]|nr:hypothetical protein [Candidatus Onthovivens sp.]